MAIESKSPDPSDSFSILRVASFRPISRLSPQPSTAHFTRLISHPSDLERIAAAEQLSARNIEILRRTQGNLPPNLDIPAPPVVEAKWFGWTSWNPSILLANIMQSHATKTAAQGLTSRPNQKLVEAVTALTTLFINIDEEREHNRPELLKAVTKSIKSLKDILDAKNHKRIFRIPGNPTDPGYITDALRTNILKRIADQIEYLSIYQGYLEGNRKIDDRTEETPCTKEHLTNIRMKLIDTLLTEPEYEAFNNEAPLPPHPKGLLAILLYIKNAQQGAVTGLAEATVDATAEFATIAIRERLGLSLPTITDIDLPKFEIRDNIIITNHVNEESTLMSLVNGCIDFFKSGNADSVIRTSCVGLLSSLRHAKVYLQGPGRELLSQEQGRSTTEHSIIASLTHCIDLLESVKRSNKSPTHIKAAFLDVKTTLSQHSIWLGSVANFGLSSVNSFEPITKTLPEIQRLDEDDPAPRATAPLNPEIEAENLATEVAELGSYQAAFQAIFSYFISPQRGVWILPQDKPLFSTIIQKALQESDQSKRRNIIVSELRLYIKKASDISFIKRLLLNVFAGRILWLCEHSITRLKNGVFSNLKEFIKNAKNVKSDAVSTEPIERLKKAVDCLYTAHRTSIDGPAINSDDAIKALFKEDPIFLESKETGCKTLSETYLKTGDLAIEKFMGYVKPTLFLQKINDSIFGWAANSKFTIVQILLKIVTTPITSLFSIINALFILPFEWITNKVTHSAARLIFRNGSIIEMGHKVLGDAMFPKDSNGRNSTKVMNQIVINLLGKLSELLDMKAEENESEKFKISKESETSLSNAIGSILKFLAIKRTTNPDALTRFDRAVDSSGLSPLVSQGIRMIMGEDEKDLDSKVAESIKELLARAYYLLMDKDILNQQLVLALSSIKAGITAEEASFDEAALAEDSKKDEATIRELKTVVLQKAALLAHTPICSVGEKDKSLEANAIKVKNLLLGDMNAPGLISNWKITLESEPLTPLAFKKIHIELRATWYELQDDMIKLREEVTIGKIGADSLDIYHTKIKPIMDALASFTNLFLNRYNDFATTTTLNKEDTPTILSQINTSLTSLLTSQDAITLTSGYRELNEKITNLKASFSSDLCPREIRSFIRMAEGIHYNKTLLINTDKLEALQTFKIEIVKIKTLIDEAKRQGNMVALRKRFAELNITLTELPDLAEIIKFENDIIAIIQNRQNVQLIEQKYGNLNTSILKAEESLKIKQNEIIQNMKSSITDRLRRVSQFISKPITRTSPSSLIESDGAGESKADADQMTPPILQPHPSRQAEALATQALEEALANIVEAAKKLEGVSSIRIPLDKAPYFKITEAAIVALLKERITTIEEELLKKRNPLMSIIIKTGVLAFLNPKNASTTNL